MPTSRKGFRRTSGKIKRFNKSKKSVITRAPLSKVTAEPYFKRTYFLENITQEAGGNMSRAYVIRFSDLPGVSEFTSLFDEFKIRKATFRFEPTYSENGLSQINNYSLKYVRSAVDLNDSSPYGSEDLMFQHDTLKNHKPNSVIIRSVNMPAIAAEAYAGPITSGYYIQRNKWIDMANYGMPHFGLRLWISQTGMPTGSLLYRVIVTLHFQCKAMK